MTKKKSNAIKGITTGLIVAGAVAYLVVTSFTEESQAMVYYKTVEETLAQRDKFEKQPVRVNGLLVEGSIAQKPGTDEFKFVLRKNEDELEILYSGILPDNMAEGKELIVEGTLQPGKDTLNATEILTKCPSKYEAEAEARNE